MCALLLVDIERIHEGKVDLPIWKHVEGNFISIQVATISILGQSKRKYTDEKENKPQSKYFEENRIVLTKIKDLKPETLKI